jgi:hypothetical protein
MGGAPRVSASRFGEQIAGRRGLGVDMSGIHFAEGKIASMRKILDRLRQMCQSNAVKDGKSG